MVSGHRGRDYCLAQGRLARLLRPSLVFNLRVTVHGQSPEKDKRQQRLEVRVLAPKLSIKTKLDKIFWPCPNPRKAGFRHSRHFRRKHVGLRADHLHACHFA